jgi:hypothetical protein
MRYRPKLRKTLAATRALICGSCQRLITACGATTSWTTAHLLCHKVGIAVRYRSSFLRDRCLCACSECAVLGLRFMLATLLPYRWHRLCTCLGVAELVAMVHSGLVSRNSFRNARDPISYSRVYSTYRKRESIWRAASARERGGVAVSGVRQRPSVWVA